MSEELEEMSAFFNSRTEIYNTVHLEHIGGGIESKQIVASFLPEHTRRITDFGVGTGLELDAIFERFPNCEVTGLDIAENMLQLLRKSYPDKKIDLHLASYLDFDFGNDLYDAALSVMTLHHYDHETKTNLYRRILNSIKPKGVYVECDYMLSEHEHENAQETEDFYFREFIRLKHDQGITDNREYHYDTPCTVGNQIKMLYDAGFSSVKEKWCRGNTVVLVGYK